MARAGLPTHLRCRAHEFLLRAGIGYPDRTSVPGEACRIVVGVKEQAAVLEICRRPQPKELRRCCRRQRLRIAQPDGTNAPRSVAGSDKAVERFTLTVEFDPALIASVLRQPRVVHDGTRAYTPHKSWLLDRRAAAGKHDVGRQALVRRVDDHAKLLQRLDHLDAYRADGEIHPLHVEATRSMQRRFNAIAYHDEGRVSDIQVRIDAERGCKK